MKTIYKILFMFILCFTLITLCQNVQANSINKISMDIYIDNNGNATVTEIWDCNINKGTEAYHPFYNLGKSTINNLSVSINNIPYETLTYWHDSGTLEDKAHKCAIYQIKDGLELCWGISSYGHNQYIVKYTISNFVSELIDSQMIYWTLIPHNFSTTIDSAYIKIHTPFNIPDTVGVWGYGNYGGTAYVNDGYIEMQSNGKISSNEYMTILVQFPSKTFNCKSTLNADFNYYLTLANNNSTSYSQGINLLFRIFILVLSGFILYFIIVKLPSFLTHSKKYTNINLGAPGKIKKHEIVYFRGIPCNKNIFRAYYIAYSYGLIKRETDILGALILKWLKDGAIRMGHLGKGRRVKEEDFIIIDKKFANTFDNYYENSIFNILIEASKNYVLEKNEFKRWCQSNYNNILGWFDDLTLTQRNLLVEEGFIEYTEKGAFNSAKIPIATMQLKQEALELAGLKKFLKDFTLIQEKEALEVNLLEEYLIFAQLFGISIKVVKKFQYLYPEIIEQTNFASYNNLVFINTCTQNTIYNALHGKQTASSRRASNYTSGSGGFSSGGGGSGSFGGGSRGGGGFR